MHVSGPYCNKMVFLNIMNILLILYTWVWDYLHSQYYKKAAFLTIKRKCVGVGWGQGGTYA